MMLHFQHNSADPSQIHDHLLRCDQLFMPPLSMRLNLQHYAEKLAAHADNFECWQNGILVGIVAIYANDPNRDSSHITNVSVEKSIQGQGVAQKLMNQAIQHAHDLQFKKINLHVNSKNTHAMKLYHKFGFSISNTIEDDIVELTLTLPINETRL